MTHPLARLTRQAFSDTVLAEQQRLAAMIRGSPEVQLSDRLLAYVMGVQAPLLVWGGRVGGRGDKGERGVGERRGREAARL